MKFILLYYILEIVEEVLNFLFYTYLFKRMLLENYYAM